LLAFSQLAKDDIQPGHDDHTDANLVFLARDTYPTAYIVATLAASWWLITFTTLHTLFILLGLVLLLGLPAALKLQDTR
jgi:hypothetical protein